MRLQPIPFAKMQSGIKTIEVRLNDEKRQTLKVGDQIIFSLMTNPNQKISTEVIGLDQFSTFRELFAAYPPEQYGCESPDDWKMMYEYFSSEEEAKCGVLGIGLRVLD